ncbi:tryptophan halogenase family protein [Thalassotalea mangrovi]|uniref:Tryptophan 7-halogenase n=1 Tax=Thalassotalea mangrovi TaxID=2572245 RepID=A0A4U1B3M8_9GAMM|nr:tryptophan halogenase family protein [Thalassotalea mangrovi]TKB44551.1 tryptophan 7-halogenase [Thalassotalea mangrovi]
MNNIAPNDRENRQRPIQRVLIVGGGTAGWLTANHLASQLKPSPDKGVEIILVDSEHIPAIGVGEGTVPMLRHSLQAFGIDEGRLIQECDATFKQGIKFIDWLDTPPFGQSSHYHHLFDYPLISEIPDLTAYWLQLPVDKRPAYTDFVAFQGQVCDKGLAPKHITSAQYQGHCQYAYHLDAAKFTRLLQQHATEHFGVTLIKANVSDVTLDPQGDIAAVVTDCAGAINADLFVDCSGFNAILLEKALGVGFIRKNQSLFVDKALAVQVPYQDAEQPIPSFTKATAKSAGWVWDIGLTTRRGCGYVYSSAHLSESLAEQDFRNYLGDTKEDYEIRQIDMNVGYRQTFWHKNCVAIGLSQGFVEPLEATGLLLFDVTAKMLAQQFPSHRALMPLVAEQFNQNVRHSWERVIDFIKLHYFLSRRDDSDFWHDNRQWSGLSPVLQERLQRWQWQLPSAYDFASGYEIFNLENYLYVLYGMEFCTDLSQSQYRYNEQQRVAQLQHQLQQHRQQLLKQLPEHRQLLAKIRQFGLQRQ